MLWRLVASWWTHLKSEFLRYRKQNGSAVYEKSERNRDGSPYEIDALLPTKEFVELRRLLQEMRDEQILSSFDTILLLLLPLSTFFLAAAPTIFQLSPILGVATGCLAIGSLMILLLLVIGKIRGSVTVRILAWYLFLIYAPILIFILGYFEILSLVVGIPINVDLYFLIYWTVGTFVAAIATFRSLADWLTRTLRIRLPKRRAQIDRLYLHFWTTVYGEKPAIYEKFNFIHPQNLFLFSIGLGMLIYGAMRHVSAVPSKYIEIMSVLLVACSCLAGCILFYSSFLLILNRPRTKK